MHDQIAPTPDDRAATAAASTGVRAFSTRRLRLGALAIAVVLAAVIAVGVGRRLATSAELHATNLASQIPTATVTRPKAAQPGAILLPGRLEAWSEAPVYARKWLP